MGKLIKIKVQKPWIGYPGSTIQQSYGEDLVHGALFWDISDHDQFDVKFQGLINPHPFVTLDWIGSLELLMHEAAKYPDHSRYRIRSERYISQADIKQIYSSLKTLKHAEEIIFKIDTYTDSTSISAGNVSLMKNDLRDHAVHVKLMKEYFKDTKVSEDTWQQVADLLKTYLGTVTSEDEPIRNTKWSLKKLEFENVLVYGKGNVIDFNKLHGITGIFAPNRSGKSSIIATLMYALFNGTDRGSLKNLHVINDRKGHCLAKATISVNSVDYLIERQTVRYETKKTQQYATTHLNLFKLDASGAPTDLNREQRKDTDREIRQLIGTSDDFLLTSFSSQSEMNKFINEGSTQRRMILSKFLDLDVFAKLNDIAKRDSSELKAQLKTMPAVHHDDSIKKAEIEHEELSQTLAGLDDQINKTRSRINFLQIQLASVGGLTTVTQIDVQNAQDALRALEKELLDTTAKLESENQSLSGLRSKLDQVSQLRGRVDIDDLRERYQSFKIMEKSLLNIKHLYETEKSVRDQQQRSVLKLLDVPCGDSFPSCKFIKDSHQDKAKLPDQITKVEKLKIELGALSESVSKIKTENLEETIDKYDKILAKEAQIKLEISNKSVSLARLESTIENVKSKIGDAKKNVDDLESRVVPDDGSLEKTNDMKAELRSANSSISALESQKVKTVQRMGALLNEIARLQESKKKYELLQEQWHVRDMILNATSKDGIPSQILRMQLPALNAEITKILQGVANFTVQLEMADDSSALEVYIDYGDARRVIECGSGMEKMISSLAIRVALLNVSSLPKTDMFIIDEGFGTLDEGNIEACSRLLVSLKKQFKNIIVISHIDGIKDVVDNMLEIVREGKDSRVVYE